MNFIKKIAPWALITLTALPFFAAGTMKLLGVPEVHVAFANLGLPLLFGYFIGVCEIAGAIGLFLKKLSSLAALGLALIMAAAAAYHVAFDPITQAIPAIVLMLLAISVLFMRRSDSIIFASKKA